LPETGDSADRADDEDGSPTPKPVVERGGKPTANKGTAHIWRTVCEAADPGRAWVVAGNTELFEIKELSTIYNGFV
jgi:hypothetical protein